MNKEQLDKILEARKNGEIVYLFNANLRGANFSSAKLEGCIGLPKNINNNEEIL